MKFAVMAAIAIAAWSLNVHASVLTLNAGPKSNNGVNISTGGKATISGQEYAVTTVGNGLRTKKVLLANVKVYVAQLLVSSPARFIHTDTEALKSLEDSETVVMHMSFLRTVDAEKVQVSFRDALDTNNVDINAPSIKAFLAAVNNGGDAEAGKALVIAIHKNSDGQETLVYEDTQGQATEIKGPKGLTQSLFATWLGTPADSGVAALKNSLIHSEN